MSYEYKSNTFIGRLFEFFLMTAVYAVTGTIAVLIFLFLIAATLLVLAIAAAYMVS